MRKDLSTSEFAEAIGVSESSVRRLADGGHLRIRRTSGGHRKIPVEEAIRYARKANAKILRPDLLGLVASVEPASESAESANDSPIDSYSQRLLGALQEGHFDAVIGLLQAMYLDNFSVAEICDGPIRFAMNEIGGMWPQDRRSIFVEHRATVLCVRALCQIRLSLPTIPEDAPQAMGAAPQYDPYLLPSLMASLVLHEAGYDEVNLGPNTPIDVLTDSVEDEQPPVVWLAITSPIRSRALHRDTQRLAEVVGNYGGRFVIGGAGALTYQGEGAIRCATMGELRAQVSPESALTTK